MRERDYSSYYDQFSREAILAIRHFNDEVLTANPAVKSIKERREAALSRLKPEQHCQLLNALIEIYPHWFTNGRRDCLGKVPASRAKEVNMQILTKLSYGEGRYIVTSSLGSLASMSGMRMTGGKRKAAVEKSEGKGMGTRKVRAMCQFHPDAPNFGGGMCKTCYHRMRGLMAKRLVDDYTPYETLVKIMQLPPARGHGKLRDRVNKILREAAHEKYA